MNRMTPDQNPIVLKAFDYLSDLQDAKADTGALFRWLAESPRHVEEFMYALTLSDDIGSLGPGQRARFAALADPQHTANNVVALPGMAGEGRRVRFGRWFAAAAVAASVAVGLGLWVWDFGWTTYSTAFGEQKRVELADGSTLELNTESRVKVKYRETARDLRLLRGEALFKVKHDSEHPFRVQSGESTIQALGTQFNVYRRPGGTLVSVLEGSVRIISQEGPEKLTVGQEAQVPKHGAIVTRPIDVRQAAAWRQRRLVFLNDSLADIAAEFNRYNRRPKVVIEDPDAATKRFAASFDVDATAALVQVLEANPELVVKQGEGEIRVRSR